MLKAVIFDMDDTLIDWSDHHTDWDALRRSHLQPVRQALIDAGIEVPPLAEMSQVYNEINRTAWAASSPPDWIAPRQRDVLRKALQEMNINLDGLDLDHLQQKFGWGKMPGVTVFSDAPSVLEAIRAADVQIGLLTNASSPMWMRDRELEAMGLLRYLDVRMTAGDVGHLKPHRQAFEAVLDALGVTAEEAVFVGDRQHDDIQGAQQVGLRAVWVRRGTEPPADDITPDAVIERLIDLLDHLDEWFPDWRMNA